ncbi:hypothetical protein [Cyclobacterium salsum]|uniref:hypothetical protein n=1 Tax=Cyclobacterium salsum TaxID=2666329 RepID=UPI00139071E0|nr:hypothetical protein [Cyclobacterium salsum]
MDWSRLKEIDGPSRLLRDQRLKEIDEASHLPRGQRLKKIDGTSALLGSASLTRLRGQEACHPFAIGVAHLRGFCLDTGKSFVLYACPRFRIY